MIFFSSDSNSTGTLKSTLVKHVRRRRLLKGVIQYILNILQAFQEPFKSLENYSFYSLLSS